MIEALAKTAFVAFTAITFLFGSGLASLPDPQDCLALQLKEGDYVIVQCATINCSAQSACLSYAFTYNGQTWHGCKCTGNEPTYSLCKGYWHIVSPVPDRICVDEGCSLIGECEVQPAGPQWAPICSCE